MSPPSRATLLVTVTGDDRPGVTSALFDALADVGAEVLDVEQVVVRGHLTLALLLAAGPRDEVLRSAVARRRGRSSGMNVSVSAGTGDNAPRRRRPGGRHAARRAAAGRRRVGGDRAGSPSTGPTSTGSAGCPRYPVTTVEFDVSGADVATLRRELARRVARRAASTSRSPPPGWPAAAGASSSWTWTRR